jgi:hypothetical protein
MTTLFAKLKWMAGACLLASLSGCASSDRVVYLGSGTTKVVRLRETIKGAKIWYKDSTGVAIPGVADLPEGGYFRGDLSN